MTPVGRFVVAADHPSLAGHFPGRPLVPGVVLLDHAMRVIMAGRSGRAEGLPVVKFSRPVLPGQAVAVACAAAEGRVSFICSVEGVPVMRGSLAIGQAR